MSTKAKVPPNEDIWAAAAEARAALDAVSANLLTQLSEMDDPVILGEAEWRIDTLRRASDRLSEVINRALCEEWEREAAGEATAAPRGD